MKKSNLVHQRGIALLLVIVILSAILSISIGIFNIIFGQILLSGEAGDSFRALYAADQAIERTLYRDRAAGPLSGNSDGRDDEDSQATPTLTGGALGLNACYIVRIRKTPSGGGFEDMVTITAAGEYRCGGAGRRVVRRGLEVLYQF